MFITDSDNKLIIRAVAEANALIENQDFINDIKNVKKFDMSDVGGAEIVNLIKYFRMHYFGYLEVVTYKSKNPFSKAYGYFSPLTPNKIFLNSRKLNRSLVSVVASLVHELIHFLDSKSKHSFGHGDNSATGKDNTAPYFIDRLAGKHVSISIDMPVNQSVSHAEKMYTPWYYKFINFIKWW